MFRVSLDRLDPVVSQRDTVMQSSGSARELDLDLPWECRYFEGCQESVLLSRLPAATVSPFHHAQQDSDKADRSVAALSCAASCGTRDLPQTSRKAEGKSLAKQRDASNYLLYVVNRLGLKRLRKVRLSELRHAAISWQKRSPVSAMAELEPRKTFLRYARGWLRLHG